jgi:hypothetical protein
MFTYFNSAKNSLYFREEEKKLSLRRAIFQMFGPKKPFAVKTALTIGKSLF